MNCCLLRTWNREILDVKTDVDSNRTRGFVHQRGSIEHSPPRADGRDRRLSRGLRVASLVAVAVAVLSLNAVAQTTTSVTLAWSPSSANNIAAYKVYYGVASNTYTNIVPVGNVTNATMSGLATDATYFFATTATASNGLESLFSNEITWTSTNKPPAITSQPQSVAVALAQPAQFTVTADGTSPLGYQWQFGGGAIAGATDSSYSIASAQPANAGNYTVAVTNNFGSVTSAVAVLTVVQGLVCWWKLDEGSGTAASDASGNGNNGTLVNSPTWTAGEINGALSFNGVNNYVSTPAIGLSSAIAVSVSLWVNRTYSNAGGHALFESTRDSNSTTTGFMFFPDDASSCSGGGMLVGLRGNAGYNLKCYAQPTSGVWHHLVAVFDKSQSALNEVSLYLDGVLQTAQVQTLSGANTNNFGTDPLYLMCRGGGGDFCSGMIDDFRVYNRTISGAEVQRLYALGGTQPAISLITPTNGTTVNGTITIAANATDNAGVVGVQFKTDGSNLGAELAAPPYQTLWDTTTASNGAHQLTAIARDAAGSTGNSAVTVTVSNTVPVQGLVCWWKLDEGSGTAASDTSGNGNNGTLVNSPTWTAGEINGALSFNGVNNYVSTPAIDLSSAIAVSVSLWVNRTYSNTGGHALFESTRDSNDSTTGFMLFPDDVSDCSGGGMLAGLRGNAGYNLKCYAQPTSGVWHHLVAVFDKSQSALNEVSLYLDGVLQTAQAQVSSGANTNNFGTDPLYLMCRGGNGDFCSGVIDDFQVYNRALSGAEVQQLYALGTTLNKQIVQTKQTVVNFGSVTGSVAVLTVNPVMSLPAPWQTADIGIVRLVGSAGFSAGLYTLQGAGTISGTADNFRFLYQSLSGDGEIQVQINSVQHTGSGGRIGAMVRESLTSNSKYAFLGISPAGTVRWQRRRFTGGGTSVTTAGSEAPPNAWARIVRSGSMLQGFASIDGVNWTLMSSNSLTMATNIYIGLALASGNINTMNTSKFSNVTVMPVMASTVTRN
jgi:hypothetical protein